MSREADYQRYRGKAREYQELWRDVWAFATIVQPAASTDAKIGADVKRLAASSRAVG